MTARLLSPLRVASLAALSVVAMSAATPAFAAADGGVEVVNTETVQVYTSPTGHVQTRRVYEQLSLFGTGTVDLRNPVSTSHLRNLDGFGGFDVRNGEQITRTTVAGERKLRSVSDYRGDLPLAVGVRYKLDGKTVEPGDVVGRTGTLEVQYTVENVTGKPQEVTFADGHGGTVTKTVDVPIPMVGSLSLVAPSSFTNVRSQQANIAGDGKGGTKLSFTMTLFPPIGSTTAVFGYTADIKDGVVPRAEISALPVNPLDSPTFKTAADSYQGGADTGAELTDGAGQIDTNLLKLRDGAGDLLAGLIKLRDGADQLNAGLTGKAAPGAAELAKGAARLDTGLGRLSSGARRLAAGTTRAADGGGRLHAGTRRLSDGARKVSDGAATVDAYMKQIAAGQGDLLSGLRLLEAGVQALPTSVQSQLAADPQYKALLGGMQKVVDGIGKPDDVTNPTSGKPATVFGGLNAIRYGLRTPGGYGGNDCAVKLSGGTPSQCGALDAVQFISSQLSQGATDLGQLKPVLGVLNGTSNAGGPCAGYPAYAPPPTPPTNPCQAVATLYYALFGTSPAPTGAQAKVTAAASALQDVYQQVDAGVMNLALPRLRAAMVNPGADANCAVGAATGDPSDDCGVAQAVAFFQANIPTLVNGITGSLRSSLLTGISAPAGGCLPTSRTLLCGAARLATGSTSLAGGTSDLAAGAGDLSDGASVLSGKTGELSAGLTRLHEGAGRLADGTGQAEDGSGRLSDGAGTLAGGLKDAADGSGRLAGGLKQAADGAPQLVDGAQKLSDQGTKKLVQAGELTAQNYGEMYATMTAGAQRAQTEDMAFGAPAGAVGLTAYSYVIQGDDGEGGRNLVRGLGGLAILGAGGGVFAVRRRLV